MRVLQNQVPMMMMIVMLMMVLLKRTNKIWTGVKRVHFQMDILLHELQASSFNK